MRHPIRVAVFCGAHLLAGCPSTTEESGAPLANQCAIPAVQGCWTTDGQIPTESGDAFGEVCLCDDGTATDNTFFGQTRRRSWSCEQQTVLVPQMPYAHQAEYDPDTDRLTTPDGVSLYRDDERHAIRCNGRSAPEQPAAGPCSIPALEGCWEVPQEGRFLCLCEGGTAQFVVGWYNGVAVDWSCDGSEVHLDNGPDYLNGNVVTWDADSDSLQRDEVAYYRFGGSNEQFCPSQ